MAVLKKALGDLSFRIPPHILNAVFIERFFDYRSRPMSLEEAIMARVIRPRVMMDCDIVGGTETVIDISNVPSEQVDITTWVLRIPKSKTQNRSIISVLGVTFVRPDNRAYVNTPMANAGSLMMSANALMQVQTTPPNLSTHRVDLIGENVILLSETSYLQPAMQLHCILGSDDQLSHIKLRYYLMFSRLVELAVKSFIYNEYIVEMDMAELRGGANLGRFKDIIENYSDAEQEYQLFLAEKWKKCSMMNDELSHSRYINALIGANR